MNFNSGGENFSDTYAEIDLKTLRKNFQSIKKFVNRDSNQEIKFCSIVKANAYGHGMCETGLALSEFGTDYLGTADYVESIKLCDYLKKNSKRDIPVLCLGILTDSKLFDQILERNIEVTIADLKIASHLNDAARKKNKILNIHVQIDSGINRIGFAMKDGYEAVQKLLSFGNFNLKGIYSHFATSEIATSRYAVKQKSEFKILVQQIEHNLKKFDLRHISNSGGILNFNEPYFNMVRPGISLYGYYPDRKKVVKDIGISPVMTLKSKVKFLKTLGKGNSISYGRKYFTHSSTNIASVPIGYGDGYSRVLTNKSRVFINGKLYKTAGAVCMDWTMVELGKNPDVKLNDEVIIFGKEYPAYHLSEIMGTIPYEITCNVAARVPRIYVNK